MRAALLLLAGCDAAFGLEHVDPDAPPDVAALHTIAASVSENFLINDANGLPALNHIVPQANALAIFLADPVTGLRTQVPYDTATGAFSITAQLGARARIQLVFGAQSYEWQWDQEALAIEFAEFVRSGQVTAPANTIVTGPLPVATPTTMGVYTTGVWLNQVPVIDVAQWTLKPWTGALASGAKGDRIYVTSYEAGTAGDLVLARSSPPINKEIVGGATTNLANGYAAVTRDHCLDATTHLAEDAARMTARYPLLTGGGSEILVYAMPAPVLGSAVAWLLMLTPYGVASAKEMYANPFPGFTPVVSTLTTRPFMLEGIPLQNTVFRFTLEQPCGSATRDLPANTVGIPAHGVLAGVALADDNTTKLALTTATATFSWDVDGPADLYIVQWYDLGSKQYAGRQIQTRATSVTVDTADFVVGHRYTISVIAIRGLVGIDAGAVSKYGDPFERAVTFFPEVTIDSPP